MGHRTRLVVLLLAAVSANASPVSSGLSSSPTDENFFSAPAAPKRTGKGGRLSAGTIGHLQIKEETFQEDLSSQKSSSSNNNDNGGGVEIALLGGDAASSSAAVSELKKKKSLQMSMRSNNNNNGAFSSSSNNNDNNGVFDGNSGMSETDFQDAPFGGRGMANKRRELRVMDNGFGGEDMGEEDEMMFDARRRTGRKLRRLGRQLEERELEEEMLDAEGMPLFGAAKRREVERLERLRFAGGMEDEDDRRCRHRRRRGGLGGAIRAEEEMEEMNFNQEPSSSSSSMGFGNFEGSQFGYESRSGFI